MTDRKSSRKRKRKRQNRQHSLVLSVGNRREIEQISRERERDREMTNSLGNGKKSSPAGATNLQLCTLERWSIFGKSTHN